MNGIVQDIGSLVKIYAKGSWPTTAPIVYIVCSWTSWFPPRFKSSLRPDTYALSDFCVR